MVFSILHVVQVHHGQIRMDHSPELLLGEIPVFDPRIPIHHNLPVTRVPTELQESELVVQFAEKLEGRHNVFVAAGQEW